MTNYIDEDFWRKALTKPAWYLLLKEDFERLEKLASQEKNYDKRKQIKDEAYRLIEEAVRESTLPMAESGDNPDAGRKPVDTIIIHHTKNKPGMSLQRLNAIQLIRIYGSYFANPTNPEEKHLKGQPIWSGHFYNSRQVFWGYHWLVREDGTSEQILDDSYIGWHAGNWDINTRSIGICIDDDLSGKEPSETIINGIAKIIRSNYPSITNSHVLGHCDVSPKTECPGQLFREVWQTKLLDKLK